MPSTTPSQANAAAATTAPAIVLIAFTQEPWGTGLFTC